jgi:hypothetical protein
MVEKLKCGEKNFIYWSNNNEELSNAFGLKNDIFPSRVSA